jgi:hypothetical protein
MAVSDRCLSTGGSLNGGHASKPLFLLCTVGNQRAEAWPLRSHGGPQASDGSLGSGTADDSG